MFVMRRKSALQNCLFFSPQQKKNLNYPPLHGVPEHDDQFCVWLKGVDEVLGQKGRLAIRAVVVEEGPGVVVPHGGGAGLPWKQKTLRMSSVAMGLHPWEQKTLRMGSVAIGFRPWEQKTLHMGSAVMGLRRRAYAGVKSGSDDASLVNVRERASWFSTWADRPPGRGS